MVHRMLPINFNRNINKMFDFGTVRFESNNVQYELYESSRESMYFSVLFIVCTHLEIIFEKNVKLFLSFFDKNLNNNFTSVANTSELTAVTLTSYISNNKKISCEC
jgi:hypothetical protein